MTELRADGRRYAVLTQVRPERSIALFDRARRVIPGGVNSPVRAFGAVGGTPRFLARAYGPYVVDEDGTEYVDLVCSWGAIILGHSDEGIATAARRALSDGTSFGASHAGEVALAEEIVARVGPVEQVRLVSSGTEATMSAIRLARGFTGRSKIVKFAGCYHGHSDALLAAAGSGVATFGLAGTPGITEGAVADTIVLPYNDLPALCEIFGAYGHEIACVITEGAAANMGIVPPMPGFNAGIAELCRNAGALFISDEVLTGFRVSRSGWYGLEGVQPDLMTFGKVMGGGLPAAAFGGRADVMACLAPSGPVYQAGTLAGNPVAVAAGLAALHACTEDVYARLDRTAATLRAMVGQALAEAGVSHRIQMAGNLFSVFFTSDPVHDYAAAQTQDIRVHAAFFQEMLARGVYLPPSAFESWFVSAAHDELALDRIAHALPAAARAAAQAADAPGDTVG